MRFDWYDYGARFYDPALGRWFVPDPAIENNHFDYSPYAYVYNNPMLFIDPFGLDSAQRANAVEMALALVEGNPEQSTLCYDDGGEKEPGDKGELPGDAMDCSGLASNCRIAGGEEDPVKDSEAAVEANDLLGGSNGVKRLAVSTVQLSSLEDIQSGNVELEAGNEVYFNNYKHVGVVTGIEKNDAGEVTHFTFVHSIGSKGPVVTRRPIAGDKYFKTVGFGKWDTLPDN